MRSKKGTQRIVFHGVEYRWSARGDDGYIVVGIWPANNVGAYIRGNFKYHETWIKERERYWKSAGDQIVITNRIVRRIIEHVVAEYGYDPQVKGKDVNLKVLDDVIQWDDANRATKKW